MQLKRLLAINVPSYRLALPLKVTASAWTCGAGTFWWGPEGRVREREEGGGEAVGGGSELVRGASSKDCGCETLEVLKAS